MQSTQPAPQGGGVSQPPAPRHVSAEAFLQATTVAWGHLESEERKAIRATCRAGRLQHDSLLTHLQLTLGSDGMRQWYDDDDPNEAPERLRASLQAVVGRGARLRSLSVSFMDPCVERKEDQLWVVLEDCSIRLAAFEACSGCPLTRLELTKSVPLTEATAQAIDAWCPQLHSLCVVQTTYPQYYVDDDVEDAEAEYLVACEQLLLRCGPRLRSLKLHGVHGWDESCFMAVRHCTALTELDLEVRWMESQPTEISEELHVVDDAPRKEPIVYRAIAQLKTLQALRICTENDMEVSSADELLPHANCVTHLSTLTALTRLHLERTRCYEHHGGSMSCIQAEINREEEEAERDPEDEDEETDSPLRKLRAAHRTSLLSALRALPQLQHLHCPTLWLQPSEAASLTALTSLTLGGLLPPLAREHALNPTRSNALFPLAFAAAPGALLPRLQELALQTAVSPRVLALLHPPASLNRLTASTLRFGVWDVDREEGLLLPEAVASVAPAVQQLTAFPHNGNPPSNSNEAQDCSICIQGAGDLWLLRPRAGAQGGHSEWVLQLQGLDGAYGHLAMHQLELSTEDLSCLGRTLPNLRGLSLQDCDFPLDALPAMRAHLPQLQRLELDLRHCRLVNCRALTSMLVQLCRPQQQQQQRQGAVQLRELKCTGCGDKLDADACRQAVLQRLEQDYGVRDVEVGIRCW